MPTFHRFPTIYTPKIKIITWSPDSVDPLTLPSVYKERHVMNDNGKRNMYNVLN